MLLVLSTFRCLLAQPILPLDFESTTISYTFTNFLGGAVTKIANPQINGINTSATVAKMIKSAGEVFGGSFITVASPVNFSTNKIIKVKVFSPVAGRKLLLKFEGAGPTFEKESVGVTTANVWQELTFDFTGVSGLNNSNNKIVFIFDLGTQGDGSANSTYLFDDVMQASSSGGTNDYILVWSDEFLGTGPPADDHWFRQTQLPVGGSWYGGEQQHYTNRNENSFITNGNLNIVAKKESFTDQGQTKQYTSARLNSKFAFMYGRVDVRAKVGGGTGTLPAIWMLGKNIDEPGGYFAGEFGTTVWPATGEIDIMEHWGNNPNVIHQSIHTPSSFGNTVNTNITTISQVSTTYHVYSLIWDANQIQFLIDDVAYYTYNPTVKDASTWPFDKPLYLLLNIALGGGGDPIDPAFTQSTLEVDYVRVYQKGGTPAQPPAEPTVAATIPTRPPGNVISMFSNAYTNVPVNTWRTNWSVAKLTETQVVGNDVKKYNRLEYVGIETTEANLINASSMLYFHLDAWTPNMTTFRIKLVDYGANGVYAGGDDKEAELSFTPTLNGWNSYEIPLADFTALTNKSHIAQLVLSGSPVGTGTVFIDNVYFHNVAGGTTNDYTLVWSDEFSGNGPILSDLWFHQTQLPAGGSWYNNEQQHYTNRVENSSTANGYLKIVAKKESFTDQGQTKQYTSARLNSKFAFTYGRVDVRAKLPTGAGTWPAIWMLGKNINEPGGYFSSQFGTTNWPATGEVDIMEHWGNNPNVIHGSIHTTSSFGNTVNTKTTTIAQVSSTFHVYSIVWDEIKIEFLVDNVAFYTYNPPVKNASTWPFDKPQYLLLNIAMGGIGGVIDPAFTQSSMEIDYVRVYQKGVTPPANPQTIAFPPIENKVVGGAALLLTATASSYLPVAFSTVSNKVSLSGSTVNILAAGRTIIKANQAGNNDFSPAPEVTQSFCINPPKPTVSITKTNTDMFILTSSASSGNKWYLNGTVIPSGTNTTFSASAAGTYKVQVTVDDCVSEFSADVPLLVTGDLVGYVNSVTTYPNPAENYIELSGIKGELSNVQLVDLAGRRNAIEFEKWGDVFKANIQHLTQGIYLLQVQEGSLLHRIKLIKK